MLINLPRDLTVCLALMAASPAIAQTQPSTPDEKKERVHDQEKGRDKPDEIGGRLVIWQETVDVVANADEPVRDSSIATKTETPLLETPRSVSIVDSRTLEDIQPINVSQVHDYTVGVTPEDESGPGFAQGFRVGYYDLRRDGLRTYTWSVREPVALERIQYLRGPASLLYGDGSPGGLVNLVLKKPLPVPRYGASLGVGGLGHLRFTGDATGPLTEARNVRYRVVAAAERLENGFDNDERRLSLLPMFSFDLGRDTTLHLDAEFYGQRGRGYRHTVPATAEAQSGDFSQLPWDLNMASPDDFWRGWNVSGGYDWMGALPNRPRITWRVVTPGLAAMWASSSSPASRQTDARRYAVSTAR